MATFEPWAVGDTRPDVGARSATCAALNADIRALSAARDLTEIVPMKAVFESVISILALVRDGLIDDEEFVGLAKCCVRACHALKTVSEGRDMDGLSGSVKKGIESLKKTMHRINSEVGKFALGTVNVRGRRPGSTGGYPILWKSEIQKTLGALNSGLELDNALAPNKTERHTQISIDMNLSAFSLLVRSGEHSTTEPAGPSPTLYPGERALQSLIGGTTHQSERILLIGTICSSRKATEMVGRLRGSDAQTFIDVVDEALESPDLTPRVRRKCLKLLYKACTGHALLPKSLQVHFNDNPTGFALYRGGFGDVWKREYRGQEVAVKVVRTYADSDLKKVSRRFCKEFVTWKTLHHRNVLPLLGVVMSGTQFAMVSEWMPNGNIDQYVKAHRDENRFELLGDVARGLIYIHGQGMVHGDLKGANILIDNTGHARLADFGLLAIISDATTSRVSSSSIMHGGTYRWMSPELFYPENFGLTDSRPTKNSDCYALGMVMYEVLSGRVPFPRHNICAVVAKVSRGERPARPRGAERRWFTDEVWGVLQRCWAPRRDHRPKIRDVLRCLEEASRFWIPLSPRRVVDPSTTNPSTRNSSESTTEESTDDSGVSSSSHAASPELSPPARLSSGFAKTPVRGSTDRDVEEAAGVGDKWVDGPLGRVDSALYPSLSDWDGSTSDSDSDISLEVDETVNMNAGTFTPAPTLTPSGLSSSHKHPITESPSKTRHPTAPPKPTSIPAPLTPKQRGGRKLRPQARTQPTSPRQSDPLLQPRPMKSWALCSTAAEPPSSSHGYNTDASSTTGPAVPPKPTRMPTPVISKQRGAKKSKSSYSSLRRDHTQPPSPWQSDISLQTAPSKSQTLLSTFVEPPSSSYGYDTPLQTPHAKSLALSSTLAEPSSSPLQYDTDSSSSICSPAVPPKPVSVPASSTLRRRGAVKLLRGVLRDHTQPNSPWESDLPPPPPPAKSLTLPSTAVESSTSYHEYETDSSSSSYYLVAPPMPIGILADRGMPKRGGRKSRRSGHSRNRTPFAAPRRSPHSQHQNYPVVPPFSPSPEPQVLPIDDAVVYNTGGLSKSRARRGRFGNRTWKSWLRSSLGKLLGYPVTPS